MISRAKRVVWKLGWCTIAFSFLVSCWGNAPLVESPERARFDVSFRVPKTLQVGQDLNITWDSTHGPAPENLTGTLLTSYGPLFFRYADLADGSNLRVPGAYLSRSGEVTLILAAGGLTRTASVRIHPVEAAEPIIPLVGPRSIVADGAQWTMCTVVPQDRYGNPLPEKTPVFVRNKRPSGLVEETHAEVHHLVAWTRLISGTTAGRSTVAVSTGETYGPATTYYEVPGWPVLFDIRLGPKDVPADARQLVEIETSVIEDGHENIMLDGTLVTLVGEEPEGGRRFIPTQTIGGVARTVLRAPSRPTTTLLRGVVFGTPTRGEGYEWSPGPAVNTFPVEHQLEGDRLDLRAGPLLGALQQFVPDGTRVDFEIISSDKTRRVKGRAESGYAHVALRTWTLGPGPYRIDVRVGTGTGRTTVVAEK